MNFNSIKERIKDGFAEVLLLKKMESSCGVGSEPLKMDEAMRALSGETTGGELLLLSPHRVDGDTVAYLEMLLQGAKEGEIVGVVVAAIYSDNAVGTGWSWGAKAAMFTALGAIETLRGRFFSEVVHDD